MHESSQPIGKNDQSQYLEGSSSQFAPIALFTFNRPEHTHRTLEALALNPEFSHSTLYIFCDAARDNSDVEAVKQTRQLIHDWYHPDKQIIERETNWGLAKSIISGVTQIVDKYESIIVLEDDMVTSPHFLRYMNTGLNMYRNDERVISIHGYAYPIDDLPGTYFIRGASCWGWATWRRGWDLFESDGEKLFQLLKKRKLMHRFNVLGSFPYRRMLLDQIAGRNNSWAVRWYASALINDKLTLHPGTSLIRNIGLDGSGSHCDEYEGFDTEPSQNPIQVEDNPVIESDSALLAWKKYLRTLRIKKTLATLSSPTQLFHTLRRRL
ncbi:MAG: hypothetical protein V7700_15685 [Halioglobus sp.]